MRRFSQSLFLCLFVALGFGPTPAAKAMEVDIWGILAYDDICRVSFVQDPVAAGISAVVRHDAGCLGALDALTGWSSQNDNGTIILYTGSGFEMAGRLDRERSDFYVGALLDGTPMEMSFFGTEGGGTAGVQQGDVFIPEAPLVLEAYGMTCRIALSRAPFSESLNVVDWLEGPCPGVLDRVSAWGTTADGAVWLYDGTETELVTLFPDGAAYWAGTLPADGESVQLYLP